MLEQDSSYMYKIENMHTFEVTGLENTTHHKHTHKKWYEAEQSIDLRSFTSPSNTSATQHYCMSARTDSTLPPMKNVKALNSPPGLDAKQQPLQFTLNKPTCMPP